MGIEIKDLSFIYEGESADSLNNINIQIKQGECLLLCGKSGCGKTTLTKLINGLIPSFQNGKKKGNVILLGEEVDGKPVYKLSKQVASVFQNPRTQFFHIEPESEIVFTLENQNASSSFIKERLDQTVHDLDIQDLMYKNMFQMSGGEKQIIAFACAYASDAEVVVLDEPSANLDIQAIKRIKNIIQLMKKNGKTLIIAEHRISYLKDIADRICVLDSGEIKACYDNMSFFSMKETQRKAFGLRNLNPNHSYSCIPHNKKKGEGSCLEIKDLTITYAKQTILENINLKILSGEVTALMGKNGTGKTSLSRCLCGLQKNCSGRIAFNGKVLKEKERKKNSYIVMQDVNHQLFGESVWDECCLGKESREKQEINRILTELSLEQELKTHPQKLSGGQKQRLAVSVALLARKKVVIFDEPTSGLDYINMHKVGQLMRELAETGCIVLVITHDMEFVEETCDRCFYLQSNGVKEIRENIQENFDMVL